MNRTLIPWAVLVAACCLSPAHPSHAGPGELVSMERQFAAAVEGDGANQAFLRFLADDGILFRPQPVQGRTFFRTQPDDPGLLQWAPAYARIARSGDLGFTTGPWTYRTSRTNAEVQTTGQYVTVWKLGPTGWQVVFDGGIGGPPGLFPSDAETDGPDDPDEPMASWEHNQRTRDLRYVEETFQRRATREGEAKALEVHGHKRVRVLRTGVAPILGRRDGVEFLSRNTARTRDTMNHVAVSGAGDLGWAWGESEQLGSGTTPHRTVRSWMRVWRRSGIGGTWRVALDLAAEYPPFVPAASP